MRSGLQHNQSLALDRAGMTVFRDMSLRSVGVWNSFASRFPQPLVFEFSKRQ